MPTPAMAIPIYVLIAAVGLVPEVGEPLRLTGIQVDAMLLILLVLSGHGLVWRFMTAESPQGTLVGDESAAPAESEGHEQDTRGGVPRGRRPVR
jgi:hypothetical protein